MLPNIFNTIVRYLNVEIKLFISSPLRIPIFFFTNYVITTVFKYFSLLFASVIFRLLLETEVDFLFYLLLVLGLVSPSEIKRCLFFLPQRGRSKSVFELICRAGLKGSDNLFFKRNNFFIAALLFCNSVGPMPDTQST